MNAASEGGRSLDAVMKTPSWDRVKHVLQAALEREPQDRTACVREMCGTDQALLVEVESLLATHEQAGSFAERPAIELLRELSRTPDGESFTSAGRVLHPGDLVGVYEIQSMLGAGGMGEVYKARDTRLDRTVAIKVLPPHLAADGDATNDSNAKPGGGETGPSTHRRPLRRRASTGLHFLVMQYLEGETLASRLVKGALPLVHALRYAIDIADALDHAHRRGIVHRDLSPVTFSDQVGRETARFGLAKWPAADPGGLPSRAGPSSPPVTTASRKKG